jgi:hypothetical protein
MPTEPPIALLTEEVPASTLAALIVIQHDHQM